MNEFIKLSVFYVYVHKNDVGRVFYVGKGQKRRAWQLQQRSDLWKSMYKDHGRSVEIIIGGLPEEEAYKKEIELIAYHRQFGPLANINDGGIGPGFETRRRMSEAKRGVAFWPKGKKRPPEFGALVSKRLKGVKKTENHAHACRLAMLGKKHSNETKLKMREAHTNGTHNSRPMTACGWRIKSMTAFAKFIGVTPLCVKQWVDCNNQDRIDREFREAFRAA